MLTCVRTVIARADEVKSRLPTRRKVSPKAVEQLHSPTGASQTVEQPPISFPAVALSPQTSRPAPQQRRRQGEETAFAQRRKGSAQSSSPVVRRAGWCVRADWALEGAALTAGAAVFISGASTEEGATAADLQEPPLPPLARATTSGSRRRSLLSRLQYQRRQLHSFSCAIAIRSFPGAEISTVAPIQVRRTKHT